MLCPATPLTWGPNTTPSSVTLGGVRLDVRRERSLSDLSEYQEFGLEDAVASALSAPGAPRASEQTEPSPTSSARANVWEVESNHSEMDSWTSSISHASQVRHSDLQVLKGTSCSSQTAVEAR